MDMTNEDVTDILALLDSLPYDELDLQTPRFRLTLRRTPEGWTQAVEARAKPTVVDLAPAGGARGEATTSLPQRGRQNDVVAATTRLGADPLPPEPTAAMEHRCRSGGTDVPSVSSGEGLVAVRAPLPGTFYRAPRPGAAPFVEAGSRVGADTVVGIVETMKLFTSVTAGTAGTVAEICLGNGEFAGRGATLLSIRAE
jgi:acetyl-CoA carboxylase biotin carboxyl carrier protein